MPVRDVVWACARCRGRDRLRTVKGTVRCDACGATFRRGKGATIVETIPDGSERIRSAAQLLDELAALDPDALGPPPPARALLAEAAPPRPIRSGSQLLGWGERFADQRAGELRLEDDQLVFTGDDGSVTRVPLLDLTSLQPSSRSLQIKPAHRPVLSISLRDASVYDWEQRIQAALRRLYLDRGLDIAEFQPRVVCR